MARAGRTGFADTRGRTTVVGDATRMRLMQAAERLIAERGIDGVSVRDITAAADTNSASIHYHFHSKEGLVHALMEDRAARIRERRQAHLRRLDDHQPTVREVAEAMVKPTFEFVSGAEGETDTAYVGFLAALLEEPSMVPALERFFSDQYDAYFDALQRARPDLAKTSAVNRVCFALHLVLNSVSEPARGLRTWIERHHPPAVDHIRDDLIDFIAGALAAP
jgi:AcrR family transcriptional regulator